MQIRIYNTLSRKKETLSTIEEGKIKMYVCGITPYDYAHLGHARSYVFFDVVRRFFGHAGYEVRFIQNFTDVDDKIIKRAEEEKTSPLRLAENFIIEYFKDIDALHVKRADEYPRVTEHMGDIISFIAKLVEKGYAYEAGGSVYFSVNKFKDYGKLSKQKKEDILAGARVEVDENKKEPADFALWKKAKANEVCWQSPWGEGRPGWHIECSTLVLRYLRETIDIHGGGQDLIFPHHENEIAQSEALTSKPFANYWLHHGLVTVKGEKMSKSLKNYITVKELLEKYGVNVIRYFLISSHYRKPLDFSENAIAQAKSSLERIINSCENIKIAMKHVEAGKAEKKGASKLKKAIENARKDFVSAMSDDFNTPKALAAFFDFIREVNNQLKFLSSGELSEALDFTREIGNVVGLEFERKTPAEINAILKILVEIREESRSKKDFAIADEIREKLSDAGILLEDTPQGTIWKFKVQ